MALILGLFGLFLSLFEGIVQKKKKIEKFAFNKIIPKLLYSIVYLFLRTDIFSCKDFLLNVIQEIFLSQLVTTSNFETLEIDLT